MVSHLFVVFIACSLWVGGPWKNWIDTVKQDLKDIGMSCEETEKTGVDVWSDVSSTYLEQGPRLWVVFRSTTKVNVVSNWHGLGDWFGLYTVSTQFLRARETYSLEMCLFLVKRCTRFIPVLLTSWIDHRNFALVQTVWNRVIRILIIINNGQQCGPISSNFVLCAYLLRL